MPDPTTVYAAKLERLATETSARLLRIWDSLAPWDEADVFEFRRIAKPIVEAAAQVGVDLSTIYLDHVLPEGVTGAVSDLIAPDVSARLFDPGDRIGRLVAEGMERSEAVASGRSVVEALGRDAAYRPARESMAELAPTHTKWQRRADAKTCKWCLSLAGTVWPSAADATFGHTGCNCVPVPTAEVAEHNQKLIDAAGGDRAVKKYKQVDRLKKSERTARKRQEQARLEQLTEPDPARRERLSIREQDWETRAERAAERLRLLTAP